MFLKVIHFFADRNLEKHKRETQYKIAEYEQEKKEAQARVKQKSEEIKKSLELKQQEEDKKFQIFVNGLEDILKSANNLSPMIKEFQTQIAIGIDFWLDYQIDEKELNYQYKKKKALKSENDFYQETLTALDQMVQTEQRKEWDMIIATPLTISNKHLDLAMKKVERNKKSQDKESERIKKRIKSMIDGNKTDKDRAYREITKIQEIRVPKKERFREYKEFIKNIVNRYKRVEKCIKSMIDRNKTDKDSTYEEIIEIQEVGITKKERFNEHKEFIKNIFDDYRDHYFKLENKVNNFISSHKEEINKKKNKEQEKFKELKLLNKKMKDLKKEGQEYHENFENIKHIKIEKKRIFDLQQETSDTLNKDKTEITRLIDQKNALYDLKKHVYHLSPYEQLKKMSELLKREENMSSQLIGHLDKKKK